MTLRMGDGPVANLPAGLDAYAGYVNLSGIGETYKEVVATFPTARHLSITTDGIAALCADVENGAMGEWAGYTYGYTFISNTQAQIDEFGRPLKLWTAHHNDVPHLCNPSCGFGFTGQADGTQWTDHGGLWDESLLADDFFILQPLPPSGGQMAVSRVFQFKPNQLDLIQVSAGEVWHKWAIAGVWHNEAIGVSGVQYVGTPEVSIEGGACWVAVEDSNGGAWVFLQTPNGSVWQNSKLQ